VRLVAGTSDGVVSTCSSSSSSGGPGGSSGGGGGSGSRWAVVRSFPVTPHLTCLVSEQAGRESRAAAQPVPLASLLREPPHAA
jgi:hypothetical protein